MNRISHLTPTTARQVWVRAGLASLGVLAGLVWLAAVPQAWEADEPAKAAKVLNLCHTGDFLHPGAPPDFYRDRLFSFYYLAQAVLHAIIRGDVFLELNLSAAVAGTIFFALAAVVLCRRYAVPIWLTMLLALNSPIFLMMFSFGDEAVLALLAFAAGVLLLSQPTTARCITAGLVFGLGLHCRPDLVFCGPMLCAWVWGNVSDEPAAAKVEKCLWFTGVGGLTAMLYWLALLRCLPTREIMDAGERWDARLFLAYLFYPFAPALWPAAVAGLRSLWRQRQWREISWGLLCLPVIFYARKFYTPKYVAVLMLPLWVAAGVGLVRSGWRLRTLTAALAVFFWVGALTPFGLFWGARGAAWILPTDDGFLPTGAFAWYYPRVHAGFFQERYRDEINEFSQLMQHFPVATNTTLVGYFNIQSFLYAQQRELQSGREFTRPPMQFFPVPPDRPCVAIATSYLRGNTFDPASRQLLHRWFAEGRLRPLVPPGDAPFPPAIEFGEHIPAGENPMLGRRILFALAVSHNTGFGHRSRFIEEWGATRWVPRGTVSSVGSVTNPPAFEDEAFCCYTNNIGAGMIYSLLMPVRYYGLKDPRSQVLGE